MDKMVVFFINEQRYGLTASTVVRVIQVVDITLVPNLPAMVLGVINLQGRIIPVFNLRKRLGLSERSPVLSDKLIVVNASEYLMAFLVDQITDLIDYDETHLEPMEGVFSSLELSISVVKLPDGIILLIQEPEQFLESQDVSVLKRVINHD